MRSHLGVFMALLFLGSVMGLGNPGSPAIGLETAPQAFVTNEFGGDVAVIDTVTDRIIGRLRIGPSSMARPRGLAVSPDGRTVYVAVTDPTYGQTTDHEWEFIAALDVATREIKTKYSCGTDPERLAVTQGGDRIYCSNEDASGASVLDVATGKVITTIPTGIEPEGVAISPDRRWVYVTAETSNTVTVIDARINKAVKSILVGSRPRIVVTAPDGARAFVSAEAAGTLSVIDTTRQAVVKTLALGADTKPVGVAVSPDGHWVYVVGGRCNCLLAVNARTYAVTTVVERMGRRPWGVAVTSDGKKIYTANGRSDDVTVIDAASLRVIRTIDGVGRGPHSVVITRGGN